MTRYATLISRQRGLKKLVYQVKSYKNVLPGNFRVRKSRQISDTRRKTAEFQSIPFCYEVTVGRPKAALVDFFRRSLETLDNFFESSWMHPEGTVLQIPNAYRGTDLSQ